MFDAPGAGGAVFRGFRAAEGAGFDWPSYLDYLDLLQSRNQLQAVVGQRPGGFLDPG